MCNYPARALFISLLLLFLTGSAISAAELVNIRSVDPSIVVDLRYASPRNLTQRALYPANMPALTRPRVAAQLAHAQGILRLRGYRLKIWDAYRPKSAHEQLWQLSPFTDYVADPQAGGSLHTWGVAIDATVVDSNGRDVAMPTDFDDFTPAAWLKSTGIDYAIRRNLIVLQNAMAKAGFYGMRTEWWHFVTKEWKNYGPIPEVTIVSPPALAKAPSSSPAPAPLPRASAAPVSRATAVTRNPSRPSAGIPAARSLR